MDRHICRYLASTKSRQRWLCRGAVDGKIPRWIKKLSRIYRLDRRSLDGSKKLSSIYQEETQKPCDKICQDKKKKGLNRSKSVEELLSLKKMSFSRRKKHNEMNATSKILKHRSNQHNKLSKHLSTYMQSIQDPKHIHTLNKSNKFYISNKLRQFNDHILTDVFLVVA